MKKIFTIIALLALTMTAGAKDFTDQLAISLGSGEPTITEATISVEDVEGSDGLYNIILKEFSFQGMNIGDVNIEEVKGNSTVGDNGYVYFEETTKEAAITNGGSIAAILGNKVTVTIKEGSCMNDDKLYLVINLPVSMAGSTLNVDATFGTAPSTTTEKNFTDQLTISLGSGEPTITEATISVEDVEGSDGLYNITLKDFSFGDVMKFGDIKIENVKGNNDESGCTWFEETKVSITVKGMSAEVTINEGSYMKGDKLYLDMTISVIGMNISAVFGTAESQTKSYTDNMIVDLGEGPSDPITATINVEKQENGKYTLQLRNFKFELAPGYALGIGHITINDVEGTDADGITVLSVKDQPVTITPGDDESIDWSMGEQLAQAGLKATINGEMTDSKLYAVIQLPLANVTVTFGEKISTGISSTTTSSNSGVEAIYDINGNKLNDMKKGLNILKKADGTTVKVIKK